MDVTLLVTFIKCHRLMFMEGIPISAANIFTQNDTCEFYLSLDRVYNNNYNKQYHNIVAVEISTTLGGNSITLYHVYNS